MSARRRLVVGTVQRWRDENVQAPKSSSEVGSSGGARAGAIGTTSEVRPRCSRMTFLAGQAASTTHGRVKIREPTTGGIRIVAALTRMKFNSIAVSRVQP